MASDLAAACAEITRLQSRVAELEKALKPFSDVLIDVEWSSGGEADGDLYIAMEKKYRRAPAITVGHLRIARQALKGGAV